MLELLYYDQLLQLRSLFPFISIATSGKLRSIVCTETLRKWVDYGLHDKYLVRYDGQTVPYVQFATKPIGLRSDLLDRDLKVLCEDACEFAVDTLYYHHPPVRLLDPQVCTLEVMMLYR